MLTFLHGGRRKTGLLTLVMACALMGGWLRSQSETDVFTSPVGKSWLGILISTDGTVSWTWADYSDKFDVPRWDKIPRRKTIVPLSLSLSIAENQRRWRGVRYPSFGGYNPNPKIASNADLQERKAANGSPSAGIATSLSLPFIPYWSVVIPLILLSMYLLFSKTRVMKVTALTEN